VLTSKLLKELAALMCKVAENKMCRVAENKKNNFSWTTLNMKEAGSSETSLIS
jgi:hypothetical protein